MRAGGGGDSEGLRSEAAAVAQAAALTAEARRPAVPKLSLPLGNESGGGGGGGGAANCGGRGRVGRTIVKWAGCQNRMPLDILPLVLRQSLERW